MFSEFDKYMVMQTSLDIS